MPDTKTDRSTDRRSQHPLSWTSRQRGHPTKTRQQPSDRKQYLVTSPRVGSKPRCTDWLIVSRNVTLTLTLAYGGGLEHLHHSLSNRKKRRKRNPNTRSYNWATLFLGEMNSETWPSRWGSLKWDSKIRWWVLRDLDLRVTALARPRSNCTSKLQTHPLVREGAQHQETHNCQTEKKNLVISSR
jgi:hypothetical protein